MRNYYPVKFSDFLKIIKVGNYPIMYAILDDHVHLEMPIENCTFVAKKFFSSLKEEMQLGIANGKLEQIRFLFRTYLKTKNYYQFYPSTEEKRALRKIKTYNNLIVKEVGKDIEYDPDFVTMKEDDINIYLYQLDKLIYRLEKS